MPNTKPLEIEVIDYAIMKAKESGISPSVNEEQILVNFGQILVRELSRLRPDQLKEVLSYHKKVQGLGI